MLLTSRPSSWTADKCGYSKRLCPIAAKSAKVSGDSEPTQILDLTPKSKTTQPLSRQAFRRKRASPEEWQATKASAALAAAKSSAALQRNEKQVRESSWEELMATEPPVMLVDAYNVLHGDPELKRSLVHNADHGRGMLQQWVEEFAQAARIHCWLVYDALGSSRHEVQYVKCGPWVTEVFTCNSEADTFIIRKAAEFIARKAAKVYVISSDHRIHDGALDDQYTTVIVGAQSFLEDLHACRKGRLQAAMQWSVPWQSKQRQRMSKYSQAMAAANMWNASQTSTVSDSDGSTAKQKDMDTLPESSDLHLLLERIAANTGKQSRLGDPYVDQALQSEQPADAVLNHASSDMEDDEEAWGFLRKKL
ncbi:uncharacterized protein HaLaN_04906 [Haematococcus lacustris]|uniref:NYN domain-containing protein n=2 Tax=Haematococcus lacustris TaxID=44745 RepID=A0A699YSF2_HAELA|nr:uncharacterized protein HaLaN_04906 [Haematococcus lacustris]